MIYHLQCILCKQTYEDDEIRYRCNCGEVLEIQRNDWDEVKKHINKKLFTQRLSDLNIPYSSGVWRYKELVLPIKDRFIVSKPEGNTNLYPVGKSVQSGFGKIGIYAGVDTLFLKHEGENPTGSFKDRGMTVGISKAKELGVRAVGCASTGNTSSSLASYAALAGMKCFVFLPKGKISASKLAQSIAYGAINIQIDGDFDDAMKTVQTICNKYKIYLLNSINPFRIEGQKTIVFELLQQLNWIVPDWIVLPGGNLGNTSAIGKGLFELKSLDIMKKLPRIAVIQAQGANPFYLSFHKEFKERFELKADTFASAIRIGNPVSFHKAKKVIQETDGIVEEVTDAQILDAKAIIDRSGIGCEPASAATVAGVKKLVTNKIILHNESVVGILTGHLLKDPDIIMQHSQKSIIDVNSRDLSKTIRAYLA